MSEQGSSPPPIDPDEPSTADPVDIRKPAKSAFAGITEFFAGDGESPLDDLRTALGHIQPSIVVWGLVGLVLFGYFSTGIYSVAPGEAAVVRRFGTVIQPRAEPGLHYRIPWPVDRIDIVNVSQVRREQVGVLETEMDHSHPESPTELQTLSGDTNVVDVEVIAQYQVRNPADYLFNAEYASYRLVRDALRGSVTSLVTGLPVDALLTTGRQSLQQKIHERTQERLDEYGSGLVIVGIDLQKAFPPADVADAFTSVNTAREQKIRLVNEAKGYANSLIPEARGEAQRIFAVAQAYQSKIVAQSAGAAQAFESVLAEYRKSSTAFGEDITRYRMYLETIDKILSRVQIYAVDSADGSRVNLRLFDGQSDKGPISVGRDLR